MAADILKELAKLEALSVGTSKSSKSTKPISVTLADLESTIVAAQTQLSDGIEPQDVIKQLLQQGDKAKADTEKGLKEWYSGLSKMGKAIDKHLPSEIGAISSTYDEPDMPLFSSEENLNAINGAILETMMRKGAWDSAEILCQETGLTFDAQKRDTSRELHETIEDLMQGKVEMALK